jgi:5'-nucleotidase
MNYEQVAIVDVDDVCALLSDIWILDRYNKDYNDNLTLEKITEWSTDKFVKPECGIKIYDYLLIPELYDEVKPREGSIEGVKELRKMGYRVVFATSTPEPVRGRKLRWLTDWGYEPTRNNYIEIEDKSLLRGDIMFDDRYDNVAGFCGVACLLTRPWNTYQPWPFRAIDWSQFVEFAYWQINLPKE